MSGFYELSHNISFWCAFTGWAVAQGIKFVRHYVRTRQIDFSYFVRTGGMPSSHSALVCSLALSVGLEGGFDSPLFATTLVFAAVVMFDAQNFRRAAGLQARVLNQMVEELFKEHHFSQEKLVEFLGHTRTEVFSGMALGIVITAAIHGLR